jgi:hypothetical protein
MAELKISEYIMQAKQSRENLENNLANVLISAIFQQNMAKLNAKLQQEAYLAQREFDYYLTRRNVMSELGLSDLQEVSDIDSIIQTVNSSESEIGVNKAREIYRKSAGELDRIAARHQDIARQFNNLLSDLLVRRKDTDQPISREDLDDIEKKIIKDNKFSKKDDLVILNAVKNRVNLADVQTSLLNMQSTKTNMEVAKSQAFVNIEQGKYFGKQAEELGRIPPSLVVPFLEYLGLQTQRYVTNFMNYALVNGKANKELVKRVFGNQVVVDKNNNRRVISYKQVYPYVASGDYEGFLKLLKEHNVDIANNTNPIVQSAYLASISQQKERMFFEELKDQYNDVPSVKNWFNAKANNQSNSQMNTNTKLNLNSNSNPNFNSNQLYLGYMMNNPFPLSSVLGMQNQQPQNELQELVPVESTTGVAPVRGMIMPTALANMPYNVINNFLGNLLGGGQ